MLGLYAMVLALMAFASLCTYWISWGLEHNEKRPDFRTTVWKVVARLFARDCGPAAKSGMQSIAAPQG